MITKITSENDLEFYAPRFQEITEALAIETPETCAEINRAVSTIINQYASVDDPDMINPNRYLQEVITEKKARSVNRDVLIDAYEAALIEHSYDSLMAIQEADIKAGLKTQQEAEQWAEENCIKDEIIGQLRAYVEDFADAAINAARTKGLVIDSLETYFSNLNDIKNLATSQLERGKFLLVMPADEPYFEIDANARTISVPADFKKYGVGVYGDHYAELLTFKIDRYFDNQDFMNTKIAINWNFTPTGSRTPAFETPQAQMAFAKDDELEPGYVVFGFFVTKEMTPSKGILSFSVTCYNEADSKITYSFNTQVAQVNINDGFTLLNPTEVKNVSDEFLNRISSSAYTPEGVSPIEDPVWTLGDVDANGKLVGLEHFLNFNLHEDGTEDETLDITTQAYAPGINTMKYTWEFTPVNGTTEPEVVRPFDTVTKPSDYFRTRDIEPQENSVYYIKENGAINPKPLPWAANAGENELSVEQAFEQNKELYELGSTYSATGAGTYQVFAQASKTTARSNGTFIKTVSNTIQSEECNILPAVKPSVTIEVESTLTPENTDFILEEEETEYKFIDADHIPVINAVVSSTDENIPLGAIALEALKDEDITELSVEDIVQNTKSSENPEGKYVFNLMPESGMIQVNTEDVDAEGEYRVRAINRRNHTYSVSDASDIVKTSFIAPRITKIDMYTVEGSEFTNVLLRGRRPDGVTSPDGVNCELSSLNSYTRNFIFDIYKKVEETDEEEDVQYDDAVVSFFVEELIKNNDGTYTPAVNNPTTHNEGEEGTYDEFEVLYDENFVDANHIGDTQGAYTFQIKGDSGWFRIRTENRYHGTLRIGYTDVFKTSLI